MLCPAKGSKVITMLDDSGGEDFSNAGKFLKLCRRGGVEVDSFGGSNGCGNCRGNCRLLTRRGDFARQFGASWKQSGGDNQHPRQRSRVSAKIVFHECKLLIDKRMRLRRSDVQSAGSLCAIKAWRSRTGDFHKAFPQKLWKTISSQDHSTATGASSQSAITS
jgi:hypothetical protein